MKWYEGIFILNPQTRAEETDKGIADLEGEIKKLQGEIVESRRLGKRTLAYPLHKNREGLYLLIYFKMDPAQLETFNRKLRLKEEVWRHLILATSEQAIKEAKFSMEEAPARAYYEE